MRLLYIFPTVPRLSETFLTDELRSMQAREQYVEWIPLFEDEGGPPGRSEPAAAISWVILHPIRLLRWLLLALRVGRTVPRWVVRRSVSIAGTARQMRATQMHAHFIDDCAVAVALAAELYRVPWSVTAHARDIFRSPSRRLRLLAARSHRVVTVCAYNRAQLVRLGVMGDRIAIIPCGIDLSTFSVAEGSGGPPAELRVLATGRLVEKKGLTYLIEAIAILRSRGIRTHCRIIGDGPEMETLSRLVGTLHLDGAVLLEGARPRWYVLDALRRADVFCLPCVVATDGDRDSMPVAVKEAMACGVPVVATREVGLRELVPPSAGELVPPHDAQAVADGLERIYRLDLQNRAMAKSSARAAAERFSLAQTSEALRQLLANDIMPPRWYDASSDE